MRSDGSSRGRWVAPCWLSRGDRERAQDGDRHVVGSAPVPLWCGLISACMRRHRMPRGEFVPSDPAFGPAPRRPVLSLVVPLFDEDAIVRVLVDRLTRVLDEIDVDAE